MHILIFIVFLALALGLFFFSFYHSRPETCAIFSIFSGTLFLILAYQIYNIQFTSTEIASTTTLYAWSNLIDPTGNYTAIMDSANTTYTYSLVSHQYIDDYYLSPLFYSLGFLMIIKGLIVDIAYLLRRDLRRRSEGALS